MPFHRHSRPRLMKTRSNDNTAKLASTDAYLKANHSRTSFSDLKSSARTCLPRQSTFPADVGTAAEMPPISKHRLSRVASASALDIDAGLGKSSTTVNSLETKRVASGASMESQRSPGLPSLPESMSKIDVEQAINLLQELRKTASPEELVSLHKALLPTRTVSPVPPPQLSSIEEHAAFSALSGRVRSERPPGLATRGSILDDPLRSQEEVASKSAKSKETEDSHGAWFQETMSAFHARTGSMTSTGTAPDSAYSKTGGAYGLGTLRITNGRAASPEPGLVSKLASNADDAKAAGRRSEEAPVPAQEVDQKSLEHQRRHSQDSINSNTALSLAQRRQQQWGLRTSRPIPSLSSVVRHKPVGPRHDYRQAPPNRRRETTEIPSTLRVSTDVPRYEQRWHHRASHLSNEYMLDCDIDSSPYDDQVHELPECSKRLSTVPDSESEDSPGIARAANACAQALIKLTSSPIATAREGENDDQNLAEANTQEHDSDVATSRFSFDTIPKRPSNVVHKQDSGYCSEVSNPASKHTSPSGSKKSTTTDATPERTAEVPNDPPDETKPTDLVPQDLTAIPSVVGPVDDAQSAPDAGVIVEPEGTKKRLSPLAIFKSRNRASKRSSTAVDDSTAVPRSNDALPRSSSAQMERPVSAKTSADIRRKTLQKRMPEPVRHQRQEAHRARHSVDFTSASERKSIAEASSTMPDQPRTVIKHVPQAKNASDADDELSVGTPPTAKPTRSWGRRSKSFARRRSKTIEEEEHEDSPSTLVPESPPKRRRSKSLAGPGVVLLRRPSMDTYCIRGNHHDVIENARADPQAAARSLEVSREVTEGNAISTMPKAVRKGSLRSKKSRESVARANASQREEVAPAPTELVAVSRPATTVEDLYPEWKSRPADESSSPAAQEVQLASAIPPAVSHRFAYDAIPPLPELPADLHAILCKADLMMSKKLKNSPKTSPRASARNSADSGRRHREAVDTGEGAQGPDLSMSLFAQTVVGEPPMVDASSDSEMPAEADGQALHKRQFSFEPLAKPSHVAAAQSPTHNAQHAGWPGWEQQSARWRQRLSGTGYAAELPCENEVQPIMCESPTVMTGPDSPSIVVSRYVSPSSAATAAHRSNSSHKRSSTVQVAGSSAGSSEKELSADATIVRRSNSIVSTSTYVTMTSSDGRPSKIEVSRNDSAFSQTTTTTTTTTTSLYTKSNGSAATLSANRKDSALQASSHSKYMPYRPTDSMHAERSRALNMARRSCQLKVPDIEPNMARRASTEVFDRYGGGLGYGWDRHAGLVGSAGTRNNSSENLNRKSVKMSEEWGLDLSDVPVFLQRTAR